MMSMHSQAESFLTYPAIAVEEGASSRADIMTFLLVLLPALVLASVFYIAGVTYAAFWIAGIAFVVSCFIAPQIGVYAYFAFQALDAAFVADAQARFSPAKALGPFLLLTWLFYLWRRRADVLVSRSFIVTMIAFGLYGLITASFAYYPLEAFRFSGQIVVQALMIIMAIHVLDTRRYVARAMFWTVVGGLVATTWIFLTGGTSHRFTRSTLGEYANPNTTAIALSIAIAAVPGAWALTRVRLSYPLLMVAVPFMFVAMLMSGTRSALISILFAFSVCIVFARGTGIVKRLLASMALLIITVGALQFALSSGLLGKVSHDRIAAFLEDTSVVSQDSRLYIWRMTFDTYLRDPLLGVGYGNSVFANLERHGWLIDVHSDVFGALVDGGPIAFAIFLYALWLLFKAVRRTFGTTLGVPSLVIIVIPLISGLTHRLVFSKWFWVPITLCLLLAEQAERERRAESALLQAPPSSGPGMRTP